MDIIYSQINYIIGVMKKEYCKYCGLELENDVCKCKKTVFFGQFLFFKQTLPDMRKIDIMPE